MALIQPVARTRRPAALLMFVLILIPRSRPAACDISRWPSTARRAVSARDAGWTEIVVAYALPVPLPPEEAAPIGASLREILADGMPTAAELPDPLRHVREPGPSASLVEGGATLLVWLERLPGDWGRLDAAVTARVRGAKRVTTALSVCLPVAQGEAPRRVERAVSRLPELARASVAFQDGAAVIRFTGGGVPTPQLLRRVHLAAMHETGRREKPRTTS